MARRLLPARARSIEGARVRIAGTHARSRSTRPFTGGRSRQAGRNWEKIVPDGFQFAVKGSRYCVMKSKLAEARRDSAGFFAQGFAALGPKLGPILWQFTHYRKFDRDDIAGLPRPTPGRA